MNFTPSTEMQEFLRQLNKYIDKEVIPREQELKGLPWREVAPKLAPMRQENKDRGWWLPQIEKEHGGMGLSVVEHGLVCAEIGRTPFGMYLLNAQAPDAGNMEILIQHGTEAQKQRFLEPLLAGETRSSFSMTEPEHAGSNPVYMSTKAVKDGDEWVINGHKWFSSAADGAAFLIVMAVTDTSPDANLHSRASMILVPSDTDGVKLERNISVMGHAGDGYGGHAEIYYDDVRVPVSNTLGGVGHGFTIAQDRLGPGRIHHCMRWMGICERCFDIMCKHVASRELAPGRTLGSRQFVQGWIAESRAEINAARLMVLDAAWKIDTLGKAQARTEISLIKFFCANVLNNVIDRALQSLGAAGMTDDFPISGYYRSERAARIYDGADEVHKISAAKQILKQYL
ncbi:MAG: acyl-CoA dehydrogenase [Gammaproteobacteria bacterium]|jgi:alkylation response protein AidB-like acyl-CoA dehydrogenase|nr:acyl-CoA dehydrogenase [Gammaproteobacteria bacterium]MDP6094859.1 acyl-CoA dehydrogenase family protein [Gammaproteobacteria bacterium]HJN95552.1 acyl-CoA dehydrogenase family protein [Gammaproteobacteria bacterium]|tara:strand:- start:65736 stop:66932 length:1197 start_codon:yes stop_codon:yes gene_type:complete